MIVYQCNNLKEFILDVICFSNPLHKADLSTVHEKSCIEIWHKNPNVLTFQQCLNSADPALKIFAESLDESFRFIDLRQAKMKDGFSWGRYWPNTVLKRYGEERIFAYQIRKSLWKRLFG